MQITGSRATVSVGSEQQSGFLPSRPIVAGSSPGWARSTRRAVKMTQARRLAITLNGYSLTDGEQSSIDLPHIIPALCTCDFSRVRDVSCTDEGLTAAASQDGWVFSQGFY